MLPEFSFDFRCLPKISVKSSSVCLKIRISTNLGGIFSIEIDPEGDIITGGGKDGRIVATSPEGEVLDETSLPGFSLFFWFFFILTDNILDYVGGCRCVVLGRNGKFNFSIARIWIGFQGLSTWELPRTRSWRWISKKNIRQLCRLAASRFYAESRTSSSLSHLSVLLGTFWLALGTCHFQNQEQPVSYRQKGSKTVKRKP